MKTTKPILRVLATFGLGAVLLSACGGSESYRAELVAPQKREAKLTISPALDVSALLDPSLADRIVIDEITVNFAEVRLLGADPRIPAGGFPLTTTGRVLTSAPEVDDDLELPFPEQFLEDDDLAVFLRLDRSAALQGASVVVRARLFSSPVEGSLSSLVADETGATDPDGEPSKDPSKGGATDPDGEPSYQGRCGATDPDGEPSKDGRCQLRQALGDAQRSVPFELRDAEPTNLVAGLGRHSELSVVVGIPAARWFSAEAVAALDQALVKQDGPESEAPGDLGQTETESEVIVLKAQAEAEAVMGGERFDPNSDDDYFIANGNRSERGTVRRD